MKVKSSQGKVGRNENKKERTLSLTTKQSKAKAKQRKGPLPAQHNTISQTNTISIELGTRRYPSLPYLTWKHHSTADRIELDRNV